MTDVAVGNTAFPNRTSRIALAPNGKAYVVYKTREGSVPFSLPGSGSSDFENAHFNVMRSDDCGGTWSALGATGVSVGGADSLAGGTFYGVFTGQLIGRAVAQLDPIFCKVDSGRQPSLKYAVKFFCGKPNTPVTAPGQYFTRSMCTTRPASLRHSRKKLRSLLPEEKAGRVTQLFDVKLGPDEAL